MISRRRRRRRRRRRDPSVTGLEFWVVTFVSGIMASVMSRRHSHSHARSLPPSLVTVCLWFSDSDPPRANLALSNKPFRKTRRSFYKSHKCRRGCLHPCSPSSRLSLSLSPLSPASARTLSPPSARFLLAEHGRGDRCGVGSGRQLGSPPPVPRAAPGRRRGGRGPRAAPPPGGRPPAPVHARRR
jgi:hypothetical protein